MIIKTKKAPKRCDMLQRFLTKLSEYLLQDKRRSKEHNVRINIHYLPAGRSVLRKTVPEVLSTARGRRPRAVLKTEGTVFLNTDRPRPANNIFIFFLLFFKS